MKTFRIDDHSRYQAYGLECQKLLPDAFASTAPFGGLKATVQANARSVMHNHHEFEMFYILSGEGSVELDGKSTPVSAGSIVFIPGFVDHTVSNHSSEKTLEFLTFWWEDLKQLRTGSDGRQAQKKRLITATPPTPNGDLHLGHVSGPYLAADILKRASSLQGDKADSLTGSDPNQSYLMLKARQSGEAPRDIANAKTALIRETLAMADMAPDIFYDPADWQGYDAQVQQFFQTLFNRGLLIEKDAPSLHDAATGEYLFQGMVCGECPHCGVGSDGNACEQCGLPNQVTDLRNPMQKAGDRAIESSYTKRLYFPLEKYRSALTEFHSQANMPSHLRALCKAMTDKPLPDICVSHPFDWGIKHSVSGYENQVVYVWAEMAVGYTLAANKKPGSEAFYQNWNSYDEIIQCFGFDNSYFHTMLMPALWLAWAEASDQPVRLPDTFVTNEFLNLEDDKFSTSRNHLIWARDLIAEAGADPVRIFLSACRPENRQESFRREAFEQFQKNTLPAWNGWLSAVFKCIAQRFDGKVPEPGAWAQEHKAVYAQTMALYNGARQHFDARQFSPAKVVAALETLFKLGADLQSLEVHLAEVDSLYDELRTNIALQLAIAKVIACLLLPIAPTSAQRLFKLLACQAPEQWPEEVAFIPGGTLLPDTPANIF